MRCLAPKPSTKQPDGNIVVFGVSTRRADLSTTHLPNRLTRSKPAVTGSRRRKVVVLTGDVLEVR